MKELTVPMSKTARQFGYIIWPSSMDDQVSTFFGKVPQVHLYFMDIELGNKNIDWKRRRISIGYRRTRSLPEKLSVYKLTFTKIGGNKLTVNCK